MHDGLSARMVFALFWLLPGVLFSTAHGEYLFRWTDDSGRPCYSNVSPPADVKEYRVDGESHFSSDRPGPVQASTDANTVESPAETEDSPFDFSAAFLRQRIDDRKKSIGHIEALLRKHPNDKALRKSLLKKEQYLFEDLMRLKNARP